MTNPLKYVVVLFGTVAIGLMAAGCNGTAKDGPGGAAAVQDDESAHDHEGEHAHGAETPKDFASGVALLKECYEEIKVAFESDKPDDAHVPLHEVGGLLGPLVKLAGAADLDEPDEETVTNALGKMFEAYGKIDETIHAGQAPDYAAVSEDLDNGMAEIDGVIAKRKADEDGSSE